MDKYDCKELRAGPLEARFENGDLRYIKLGEHEILRRIYAALRDRNWGTVPAQISNLKFEIQAESFQKIRGAEWIGSDSLKVMAPGME